MCVIAVYPKGLPFNISELKTCFRNNPDGAGVMWQDGNKVHIKKGFMEQKSLFKFLKTLPTDVDRVIHFRIATSGKVSGACCHPFPVVNDFKTMMKTEIEVPVAYAHNGVLVDYTPKEGMKSPFSDTMVFGKEVLDHLVRRHVDLFDPVIDVMIESTIDGDRMVIMNDHEIVTMGKFITSAVSGAQYSNSSYSYERNLWKYTGGYYDTCGYYHVGGYTNETTTKKSAKDSKSSKDSKSAVTIVKAAEEDGSDNIYVSFTAEITFDPSSHAIRGYTRNDYEQFIMDNLEAYNVYGVDSVITAVGDHSMTFSVECMAYADDMIAPFYNVYEGLAIHDTWASNNALDKVDVDIAISDLDFCEGD